MQLSLVPPTAAEFRDLYQQTGWRDVSLETCEAALAGTWLACTARDENGAVVGMGRLISDGVLHAFVTEMLVAESARGGGVGAQIIRMLVDAARERGVDDIQLFAARGRVAFYERNGFRRRPDDAPGMDVADGDEGAAPIDAV